MSQKIAKHRANNASNDVHCPTLGWLATWPGLRHGRLLLHYLKVARFLTQEDFHTGYSLAHRLAALA